MIIIAVILVIWIYRRRQRDNNPRLIDNEMIMNNISEAEGRERDSNLRRDVSSTISVSSRSCSDTVEPSNDVKSGEKASTPVCG